jgi:hypothetical protein
MVKIDVNALLRLPHLAQNEILEMEMGPTKKPRTVDKRKNQMNLQVDISTFLLFAGLLLLVLRLNNIV